MAADNSYTIEAREERTMFGKRTGKKTAVLLGACGQDVAQTTDVSAQAAKRELLKGCAEMIKEERPSYIFCGDGTTVLTVFRAFGGWEYEILDATRTYPAGCMMNVETRQEAVKQACAHADQSYGGVLRVLR